MSKQYEVWVYPTPLNTHSKPRQIGGRYDNRDDAMEALWLDEVDEPAPDKYDFYSWQVVEVSS